MAGWRGTDAGRCGLMRRRALRNMPFALALVLALVLGAFGAAGPLRALIPVAGAHAVPVRSDPPKDAILQAPPSQVRMWFSEDINPLTSKLVVVDPANREVDNGDSHVSSGDSSEMEVSLQLLKAGTYIVFWRSQSADDGHITAGTYLFRIAQPDGTVPPVPAVLPTGNFPGAGGTLAGTGDTLDAVSAFQALAIWLALLAMTFWVGGVLWETWILPEGGPRDGALRVAAGAAARRFARIAPNALAVVILADVGMVLAQSAALAGSLAGAFSPAFLRAILFGSRFGLFWWMRQLVAAAALILYVVAEQRGWVATGRAETGAGATGTVASLGIIPDWRREVVATFRGAGRLPRRLAEGWRDRTWFGRAQVLLGLALIVAFALSGHAAAVPARQFIPAIAVDLLHLVAEAVWLGGLFYIGIVLVPALRELEPRQRARVLALGLPEFGVVAILAAILLAATGSLNATIRLTSIEQFLTTSYGRTLALKIELFLVMVAISAYHAFFLRPRLAAELGAEREAQRAKEGDVVEVPEKLVATSAGASGRGAVDMPGGRAATAGDVSGTAAEAGKGDAGAEPPLSPRAGSLEERLRDWLRREALIGGAVLLCVALLAIFAGSLAPAAAPTTGSTTTGQQGKPFVSAPQQAGPYTVTLTVSPDRFGSNTFEVTLKDGQGKAVTGAGVVLEQTMLDMDMGSQSDQLKADPTAPGTYTGQTDLAMAGHWRVVVKILPPDSQQTASTTFTFSASY